MVSNKLLNLKDIFIINSDYSYNIKYIINFIKKWNIIYNYINIFSNIIIFWYYLEL